MRVRVSSEKCQGHALCNQHAPDVYTLDDLGYCNLTVLDVPPALEQQARRGAESCPERAITIEADDEDQQHDGRRGPATP